VDARVRNSELIGLLKNVFDAKRRRTPRNFVTIRRALSNTRLRSVSPTNRGRVYRRFFIGRLPRSFERLKSESPSTASR